MSIARKLIEYYNLRPHPEGGYYRETYRSEDTLDNRFLPDRYSGDRQYGSAILYLLTAIDFSALHRLKSDEVFHFYSGDPVRILTLYPDRGGEISVLGNDMKKNHHVQFAVPHNCWMGLELVEGGEYALLGTTMAPAFDFDDFELGHRSELIVMYPEFKAFIERMTHE